MRKNPFFSFCISVPPLPSPFSPTYTICLHQLPTPTVLWLFVPKHFDQGSLKEMRFTFKTIIFGQKCHFLGYFWPILTHLKIKPSPPLSCYSQGILAYLFINNFKKKTIGRAYLIKKVKKSIFSHFFTHHLVCISFSSILGPVRGRYFALCWNNSNFWYYIGKFRGGLVGQGDHFWRPWCLVFSDRS